MTTIKEEVPQNVQVPFIRFIIANGRHALCQCGLDRGPPCKTNVTGIKSTCNSETRLCGFNSQSEKLKERKYFRRILILTQPLLFQLLVGTEAGSHIDFRSGNFSYTLTLLVTIIKVYS